MKRHLSFAVVFRESRRAVAAIGDLHVITIGGEAQCVVRTTHVDVVPFDRVTSEHAVAEGEADGTLSW